jgi:hypothetical protein
MDYMDLYSLTTQEILDRISRHCPGALSAYLQCINRANKKGEIFFSRQMIDVDLSEDLVRFRTNIKQLARENLLEWHPFDGGISVTLAEIHADD